MGGEPKITATEVHWPKDHIKCPYKCYTVWTDRALNAMMARHIFGAHLTADKEIRSSHRATFYAVCANS